METAQVPKGVTAEGRVSAFARNRADWIGLALLKSSRWTDRQYFCSASS
jgi:hypothetical protein